MSEMIETVARALCVAAGENPDHCNGAGFNPAWTAFAVRARTAIQAMLEPSAAMIERGEFVLTQVDRGYQAGVVWSGMIDEALR